MRKLRVMTVVGTRPEIIRLSRVMAALDRATDHVLVHTGQNYDYELNQIFFEDLGIRAPDHFLEAAGATAAATIGEVIARTDGVLAEVRPDAMLVLGDTNSCLAAIPAKRRKVPVFHMEAGNRCFDERVPEEINRRIIDHIADVNLPYSDIAREYLLREGLPPDRVVKTGSPMYEVLAHYRPRIDASDVLARLELEPEGYFVVSAHREENVDEPDRFERLLVVLDQLAEAHGLPVIVSTHPRTRKRLEAAGARRTRWCASSSRSASPTTCTSRCAPAPRSRTAAPSRRSRRSSTSRRSTSATRTSGPRGWRRAR
jgi:UDP-N-acetylglucosamine 2-epimerase